VRAYYNDTDPFVCDWLAELMKDGLIAEGDIDRRSITDIDPADLRGYTRCHFFAGIGGWDLALQMAGWPEDREVWTGSCPCQPFSSAGKQRGTDDERHLWPAFHRLIAERKPATVFGEQVASKAGRAWLAGVFADLEALAYRRAGADLCAAGVGAPHIRQRLWWLADAEHGRSRQRNSGEQGEATTIGRDRLADERDIDCGLVHRQQPRPQGHAGDGDDGDEPGRVEADAARSTSETDRDSRRLGHADRGHGDIGESLAEREANQRTAVDWSGEGVGLVRCVEPTREVYRRAPLEPSLFPLAHGAHNRVGTLRGAGNAIVPQVAAEFVMAFLESE
jgi:DNA (cytosine-5)-methyltransferase 1